MVETWRWWRVNSHAVNSHAAVIHVTVVLERVTDSPTVVVAVAVETGNWRRENSHAGVNSHAAVIHVTVVLGSGESDRFTYGGGVGGGGNWVAVETQ